MRQATGEALRREWVTPLHLIVREIARKEMNQERRLKRSRGRALLALALLAALISLWLMVRQKCSNSRTPAQQTAESPQQTTNRGSAAALSLSSTPQSLPLHAKAHFSEAVHKETMLRQLKSWVRKREGHDVEIITSEDILDLNGNPVSLNVIVTTLPNGELTKQGLQRQLQETTVREHALREQLAKAQQEGNIADVNRLVAKLVASRTAFVTNNGLSS